MRSWRNKEKGEENGYENQKDGDRFFAACALTFTAAAFAVSAVEAGAEGVSLQGEGDSFLLSETNYAADQSFVYTATVSFASFTNTANRNDGVMNQYYAVLSAFIGRELKIRVVDDATGGWGCIAVDAFVTYYAVAPDTVGGIVVK